jgi:hypothetical protein
MRIVVEWFGETCVVEGIVMIGLGDESGAEGLRGKARCYASAPDAQRSMFVTNCVRNELCS